MKRVAILNIVGLSPRHVGEEHTPRLKNDSLPTTAARWCVPPSPAVTCTAQSTYLTGLDPGEHGIVGNGWYDRATSPRCISGKLTNHLVAGQKLFVKTCAAASRATPARNVLWVVQHVLLGGCEHHTPPDVPRRCGASFDIYSSPLTLRDRIKKEPRCVSLSSAFWGPRTGADSSRWIAAWPSGSRSIAGRR